MPIPHTKDASGIAHSPKSLRYDYKRHLKERVIEMLLFLAAFLSVFITFAIIYLLVSESLVFFEHVSVWEFLTDTQWTPLFDNAHYGILPLVSGTAVSSAVALVIALPLGTIIAIYLSEFAPFAVREVAKPLLELLGGFQQLSTDILPCCLLRPCYKRSCLSCPASAFCPQDW